jgi:hypothetical protein
MHVLKAAAIATERSLGLLVIHGHGEPWIFSMLVISRSQNHGWASYVLVQMQNPDWRPSRTLLGATNAY